ncbi:MAG: YqiJ family protein [Pseudomonadota bacterium]
MEFFAPYAVPFSAALLLMLLLVAAEVVGVLIGFMPSAAIDNALPDFDADLDVDLDANAGPFDADAPQIGDTPGGLSRFLGWLSVGKVPVLVLLMAFLAAFGLIGIFGQAALVETAGFPLPMFVSVPLAIFSALYPTRWLGRGIAKVLPKETTEATSSESFIGRVATVTTGTARRGLPAEAKLTDSFGQAHYLRVEPDNDDETFTQGADVLVTGRARSVYRVISPPSEYLN